MIHEAGPMPEELIDATITEFLTYVEHLDDPTFQVLAPGARDPLELVLAELFEDVPRIQLIKQLQRGAL